MKRLNRKTELDLYRSGKLGLDYIEKYYGVNPFPHEGVEIPQQPICAYDFGPDEQPKILTRETKEPGRCCGDKEQMPTVKEMIGNITDSFWQWKQAGYKMVSEEEHAKRMAYCNDCDHLTDKRRCTKCGCFMELKSKLDGMTCPIGKW